MLLLDVLRERLQTSHAPSTTDDLGHRFPTLDQFHPEGTGIVLSMCPKPAKRGPAPRFPRWGSLLERRPALTIWPVAKSRESPHPKRRMPPRQTASALQHWENPLRYLLRSWSLQLASVAGEHPTSLVIGARRREMCKPD